MRMLSQVAGWSVAAGEAEVRQDTVDGLSRRISAHPPHVQLDLGRDAVSELSWRSVHQLK